VEQGRASGAKGGRAQRRSEVIALTRPWNATIADAGAHRFAGRHQFLSSARRPPLKKGSRSIKPTGDGTDRWEDVRTVSGS
jgi:hypothetical protein